MLWGAFMFPWDFVLAMGEDAFGLARSACELLSVANWSSGCNLWILRAWVSFCSSSFLISVSIFGCACTVYKRLLMALFLDFAPSCPDCGFVWGNWLCGAGFIVLGSEYVVVSVLWGSSSIWNHTNSSSSGWDGWLLCLELRFQVASIFAAEVVWLFVWELTAFLGFLFGEVLMYLTVSFVGCLSGNWPHGSCLVEENKRRFKRDKKNSLWTELTLSM